MTFRICFFYFFFLLWLYACATYFCSAGLVYGRRDRVAYISVHKYIYYYFYKYTEILCQTSNESGWALPLLLFLLPSAALILRRFAKYAISNNITRLILLLSFGYEETWIVCHAFAFSSTTIYVLRIRSIIDNKYFSTFFLSFSFWFLFSFSFVYVRINHFAGCLW